MRIVFFDFVTHFGGMPRATLDVVDQFPPEIEFLVVDPYGACQGFSDALKTRGIRHHVLLPAARFQTIGGFGSRLSRMIHIVAALPELNRVRRHLRQSLASLSPDVVWTSSLKGTAFLRQALPATVPIAFHFRQAWRADMLRGWQKRALFDPRTYLLVLSKVNRDAMIAAGVNPDRICIVPDAVEVSAVQARASLPLTNELPQRNRPVRLLVAGTLVPRKGQLTALNALKRVLDNGLDAVLYLAGDVPDMGAKPYFAELQATVRHLGIDERVVFLGWRQDVPQLMAASTAVLLPSSDEGSPLVLLEAMSLNRPVVTTPVGDIPDMVSDRRTGWLHSVGDHEALAHCIFESHDLTRRDPIVANAFEHVSTHFSPQRQRELAIEAFNRVVLLHSPGSGSKY